MNRRRFLQLSAAGLAALPALRAHGKTADPTDVSLPVTHSKDTITKTPYKGHTNGVAKLPAWDGATSSESVPGSMRMFRGNLAGTYYGSGKLAENLVMKWKFRMSDFATQLLGQPKTWGGTGWTGQTLKYGDYVYSGSVGGHFHCWEAMTGKLVWVFAAQRMFKGSPCLYKNRIYVPNVDNHIRCLDATNGKVLWDWSSWADNDSSPRVSDGLLYIGGEDGDLKCFDPENGKLLWKESYGRGEGEEPGSEGIEASLAIADNIAYFGHLDGHVRAYHLKDRKLVWKSPKLGLDIDASILILGDRLYVGIEEGKHTFLCLDRATGKTIWGKEVGGGIWGSPAKSDKNVIVGGNGGRMYCFDAQSGDEVWHYNIGHGTWFSPQVVDGKVVFGSYGKYLEMLDEKTGKQIWKADIADRTHSGAAIEDGHIWLGGGAGYMYCFGPP
ncbi:MAG TPA: PQQ-binding-like beta-propeller repeat protein [Kofleriaceae bacterium]|nr:PQQ-binding-like beta-propeller repeat protein [Kofleriaceae bacterium]